MIELLGKRVEVRFGNMGRVRCEPGWHLGPDWAPRLADYDLWFVWAGSGRMRTEEGEVALHPGVVFWMRPGRRYEAEQDKEARLGVNFLHFDLWERGRRLSASRWTPPVELMRTKRVELHDAALRRVIMLARAGAAGGRQALAERWFGTVLTDLLMEQSDAVAGQEAVAGVQKHHHELIERVVARIRESPGDVPTVAELAREAGYGADHFSRVFSKVTGESPQEHVIRAKMERARQLLAESSLSVGMVAEALGFRDVFFFSRQFRQRTGETPSEFRRGLRGER